jgi:hypothetical protein
VGEKKNTKQNNSTTYYHKLFRRRSCLLCHRLWAQSEILGLFLIDWLLWKKKTSSKSKMREDLTANICMLKTHQLSE